MTLAAGARYFAVALLGAALVTIEANAAVVISSDTTQNMACEGGVCSPTANDAVLNVSDLENLLASGGTEVTTTGSGVQADDIVIEAALSWTSANSLALDAYQSIKVDQAVSVSGSGGVSLVTNDGGSGGTLSFHSGGNIAFADKKNQLSINSKKYKLVNTLPSLASAIALNPNGHYALSATYDASKDGIYTKVPIQKKFKGIFNGLGNSILNLTVNSAKPNVALFTSVALKGAVNSLLLKNAQISGRETQSGLATEASMIAAINYGTVFNSFASGAVSAQARVSGGVVDVGGLVASNAGTILDSGSDASIAVSETKRRTDLVDSGGLAGVNIGIVEQSYALGSSSLAISQAYSGGLIGLNSGGVENCYSESDTNVTSVATSYVGGLVGYSSAVASSYSTGMPTASNGSYVGGFVGYDDSSGGYSDDYWDITTSGITNLSQGAGNIANDPGITGETTEQLQSGLPAGFDPSVWAEDSNINGGLPYLIANPPQ